MSLFYYQGAITKLIWRINRDLRQTKRSKEKTRKMEKEKQKKIEEKRTLDVVIEQLIIGITFADDLINNCSDELKACSFKK